MVDTRDDEFRLVHGGKVTTFFRTAKTFRNFFALFVTLSHFARWRSQSDPQEGVTWYSGLSRVAAARRGRRPSAALASRERVCVCVCARIALGHTRKDFLSYYYLIGVPCSVSCSVSRSVSLTVSLPCRKRFVAGSFAVSLAVSLAVPLAVSLAVSPSGRQRVSADGGGVQAVPALRTAGGGKAGRRAPNGVGQRPSGRRRQRRNGRWQALQAACGARPATAWR